METKNNMNMRPAPKKDENNGLLGGALGAAIGTAFGAVFGVGGAYAYSQLSGEPEHEDFDIQFNPQENQEVAIANHPEPPHPHHHHDVHHVHQIHDVYVVNANDPDTITGNNGGGRIITTGGGGGGDTDPEVRVLSYERVTMDDGSQMDVATVSINGQEAAIVDVDLDGWADGMIADVNSDGSISEDEITSFEGADVRIEMSPLAQAVNYDPDNDTDPLLTDGGDVTVVNNEFDPDGDNPDPDDPNNWDTPPDPEIDEGGYGDEIDTDDDLILASNDGTDMPDYVNDGDVSDLTLV